MRGGNVKEGPDKPNTFSGIVIVATAVIAVIFISLTINIPKEVDFTDATPLIPRQVLFGNPDKAMVRLSPDGTMISYLAPVDGVMNVWVGPAEDPASAEPVTSLDAITSDIGSLFIYRGTPTRAR